MISILIPVFNYDITLLVEQIYKQAKTALIEFEILLADDASTDEKTKNKNQDVSKLEYVHVFSFQENRGRTFTRNFLAGKAKFATLLFLDADVLPKDSSFLIRFLEHHNKADLIFGGIVYTEEKPENNKILRWKYGKHREAKSVEIRIKNPYISIISGAIFIQKDLFLSTNKEMKNLYGLDSVFVENLRKEKAKVLHIDNPVIHLGLETNSEFLQKTISALDALIKLEKKSLVSLDYRPVQKAYLKLESSKMRKIFIFLYKIFEKMIEKNLLSKNPSLFYFDLFKLNYYCKIKMNSDHDSI